MNLIAHYACAAASPPEVRLGSALPDLVGLYRRKVRPLALLRHWEQEPSVSPPLRKVAAGVRFHHRVDARFHKEPLFTETAAALQQVLRGASMAPGLKRFLPAHVLCELYLDHLLLRQHPTLADGFYRDLTRGLPVACAFVAPHPQADAASLQAFLEHIVAERFVDAYESVEGLLRRMNRILARYRQRPLGAAEQQAVTDYFAAERTHLAQRLEGFLRLVAPWAPAAVHMAPDEATSREWPAGLAVQPA